MIGIFLDCETNGLNPMRHRVLEIAFRLVDLEKGDELASFTSIVYQDHDVWEGSDPGSLEVNGFTREMADQGRRETDVAADIKTIFEKCGVERRTAVFICQNPSFDRAFFSQLISPDEQEELGWPYHWLDLASMHWGRTIADGEMLPWVTGYSKDRIAQHYALPPEAAPHRAMGGVDHLIQCYDAVISFPATVEILEAPSPRN